MITKGLSQTTQSHTIQVLIVEDEQVIAINLRECLESMGYAVPAIATSAQQAIEIAAARQPNLVLMDIRLQGERDGIDAAEQIWNTLQIPVIYVTGHSDQSTIERAKMTAPFGYLLKPIRERELYVAIEATMQRYEREQLLLTVFKNMGDAVLVADTHNRVKFLNPMAEQLTGWRQEDARNRPLAGVLNLVDATTQQALIEPLIIHALQQNKPIYVDTPTLLMTKAGTSIPISESITALKNNAGETTGVVIVFRDVTQRLLAEERDRAIERIRQMQVQTSELQQLNQLKEDFLATTSHELRTPLSNMKAAIRLLELTLDQQGLLREDTTEQQPILHYLSILNQQCDQELALVNDLLDMRSLDANPTINLLNSIQLEHWLPHVLEGFQERALQQQQTFRLQISADLPPLITELPSLTRIISELLHNACKYTPPNGQIEVMVEIIASEQNTLFQLQVCNSGVEIPSAELSQIFEPFYRIPTRDPWQYGGTGLGLALVKKLVHRLQGTIEASSDAAWTRFTLLLPNAPSSSLEAE